MKIFLINPAFFDGKEFRNRHEDYVDWIKGGNLYVAPSSRRLVWLIWLRSPRRPVTM